jgi:hypothetical protein
MLRVAEHTAHRRNSPCYVHEKCTLDDAVRLLAARNVGVHLGQAGDQELAASVYPAAACRHRNPAAWSDRGHPASLHQHRLLRKLLLPIHWYDRHVHERNRSVRRCRGSDNSEHRRKAQI